MVCFRVGFDVVELVLSLAVAVVWVRGVAAYWFWLLVCSRLCVLRLRLGNWLRLEVGWLCLFLLWWVSYV